MVWSLKSNHNNFTVFHSPHFQEYADYLSDLSPEQASDHNSSIRQAQDAARELEEVREKLEEQKHENEARLKKEMEGILKFALVICRPKLIC